MKNILYTIILSFLFSSPSYGEWTKVAGNLDVTAYVDFDKIRKHNGSVYFWDLYDYTKPSPNGMMSTIRYIEGDCIKFRLKILSDRYYKEPMGLGEVSGASNIPAKDWYYPPSGSVAESKMKSVCNQ